jgi:hypothetical protein
MEAFFMCFGIIGGIGFTLLRRHALYALIFALRCYRNASYNGMVEPTLRGFDPSPYS